MKKIAGISIALGLTLTLFATAMAVLVPNTVTADTTTPTSTTNNSTTTSISFQIQDPLKSTKDLPTFLQSVLNAVVELLTPVVVVMMLYAGFLFISAQGNAEKLGEAKKALLYTMIGAAIVLGAAGFADIIKNTVTSLAS